MDSENGRMAREEYREQMGLDAEPNAKRENRGAAAPRGRRPAGGPQGRRISSLSRTNRKNTPCDYRIKAATSCTARNTQTDRGGGNMPQHRHIFHKFSVSYSHPFKIVSIFVPFTKSVNISYHIIS